jgi:hypothetical protein
VVRVIQPLLSALAYLHEQGIIHRSGRPTVQMYLVWAALLCLHCACIVYIVCALHVQHCIVYSTSKASSTGQARNCVDDWGMFKLSLDWPQTATPRPTTTHPTTHMCHASMSTLQPQLYMQCVLMTPCTPKTQPTHACCLPHV